MAKKYFFLLFLLLTFGLSFAQTKDISKDFKLYPNPASTFFAIDSHGIKIDRIEIYSLLGIKESEIRSNFKYIRIDHLPKGIYMIRIYSKKAYVVKKMIKNQ